jgi:hypothetical protein
MHCSAGSSCGSHVSARSGALHKCDAASQRDVGNKHHEYEQAGVLKQEDTRSQANETLANAHDIGSLRGTHMESVPRSPHEVECDESGRVWAIAARWQHRQFGVALAEVCQYCALCTHAPSHLLRARSQSRIWFAGNGERLCKSAITMCR